MAAATNWVLLSYRLPREPSTPRAALWRSLRKLGAVQVVDGLVAVPDIERTREQLEWLAEEVVRSSGEAFVWTATLDDRHNEATLVDRSRVARTQEYAKIEAEATATVDRPEPAIRARTAQRLRRELHQVHRRDFFSASGRDTATQAVATLRSAVEATR